MSDRIRLVVGATVFILFGAAAAWVFATYTASRETFAVVNAVERGARLDPANLRVVEIQTPEADQLVDAGTVAMWIAEGWTAQGPIGASRWLRHGDFSHRPLPADGSVKATIPVALPADVVVGDWFRLFVEDATLGTAPWPCRPAPETVVETARAVGFPLLGWTADHVLLAAAEGHADPPDASVVEGMDGWGAYAQMVVWHRAGLAPGVPDTPDGLWDVRGLTVYQPDVDLIDHYDQLCGIFPFQVVEHTDTSVTVHVPVDYQQPLLRLVEGCCRAVELPEGEPWDSFSGPTPPLPPQMTNLRAPLFAAQLGPEELAAVGAWRLVEAATTGDTPEPADG